MSHHNVEPIVSTEWVENHLDDPDVVLLEVDVDTSSYDESHIPGAVGLSWRSQLQDQVERDLLDQEEFQELAREAGIDNDDHVVLYGDNFNWFAAWALWQFNYYGFENTSLMDGGREKWLNENRPVTTEVPDPAPGNFSAEEPNEELRAYRDDVQAMIDSGKPSLVDVRSTQEYTGEVLAPEGMSETCQRGGHVPGASNITWKEAINDDGTFKSEEELREIYESKGIKPENETITYCRIGERSSHSWFVLKYLLGYENVRNYDGSWTEWGNLVAAPVETGK
jgi:thiosulfate/3-mercaptopyruvate sulfurtransferase